MASGLQIEDESQLREIIEKVRDENDKTDWVVLGYTSKNEVKTVGFGEGGLSEFHKQLDDSKVLFGVLSFRAEDGDSYNTAKNILITWIGNDVGGGMAKARAGAHRSFLRDFIQETANVACELQANTLEELNHDNVGQAICRTRGGVYTSARSGTAQQPKKSGGGTNQFQFLDPEAADAALQKVASSKNSFAIFAYVKDQKGVAEHILSGEGGIEDLAPHWPPSDRAYFVYHSIVFDLGGKDVGMGTHNKFVVVTMIGDSVSPIARARTAGQRQEFIDYIKNGCPYHTEFQPNDTSDLKTSEIMAKFA
uniref:Coactosin n=1 Tax=Paramoeba aestuarina TaxID=180227 RepID=A0A7S4U894_9EUKA|eukprot:CAMPEP_0201523400 /NCGR_PEP_ID=MMETSP0161_2-20130828/19676_1 /ASSEMBLY_ACC=CAM_ASM_000251 /TAXON_ID=180227 /ORGANISM="Neoparamoeba aestuarina, Strain SoJaBio B1-5/56/2" /LENGTH=307 /DNA_ID=CAMNT_0047922505 /DNA_START=42 /DNA_END=965 /DNA_ORIENTATION=-